MAKNDDDLDELWGELALPAVKAACSSAPKKKKPEPQMRAQHEDEPEPLS